MRRALLVVALGVSACTQVQVHPLDERTVVLSGSGAWTSMANVEHTILVRAATEAQARGFPFFAILGADDTSTSSQYTTPVTSNTTGQASCFGSYCSGQATTNTYGGQTYNIPIPGQDVTIRFLTAEEAAGATKGVWNTASVLAANPRRRR